MLIGGVCVLNGIGLIGAFAPVVVGANVLLRAGNGGAALSRVPLPAGVADASLMRGY